MVRLFKVVFIITLLFSASCAVHFDFKQNAGNLSGIVMAGPVSGATITVYLINSDGSRGASVGTGSTNSDGSFSLTVDSSYLLVPIEVVVTGGSYVEEGSGNIIDMTGKEMTLILPIAPVIPVGVTPLTTLATNLVIDTLASSGGDVSNVIQQKTNFVEAIFGISDITASPIYYQDISGNPTTSEETNNMAYGMAVAGLSNWVEKYCPNLSSLDVLSLFQQDAQDGYMDGKDSGAPIAFPAGCGGSVAFLSEDYSTGQLTEATQAIQEEFKILNPGVLTEDVTPTYVQQDPVSIPPTVTIPPPPASGSLDLLFGGTGVITTSSLSSNVDLNATNFQADSWGHAIQSDGKIVFAGERIDSSNHYEVLVVRYLSDGTVDNSFGPNGNGVVVISLGDWSGAYDLKIQKYIKNGVLVDKIVVIGWIENDVNVTPGNYLDDQYKIAIVRLNLDGALDTSFGGTGKKEVTFQGNFSTGWESFIAPNGDILVAGLVSADDHGTPLVYSDDLWEMGILKLNADDGSTAINKNILIGTGHETYPGAFAITAAGQILVGGYYGLDAGGYDAFLIRLTSAGDLDTTFGTNGFWSSQLGDDGIYSLHVLSDGSIIGAGWVKGVTAHWDSALFKITGSGQNDTSFSGDGVAIYTYTNSSWFDAMVVVGDKIIASGTIYTTSDYHYAIWKINLNGTLDSSFGGSNYGYVLGDGITDPSIGSEAYSLTVQADGKKAVFSGFQWGTSFYYFLLGRINL